VIRIGLEVFEVDFDRLSKPIAIGQEGFAWNQKPGQSVFDFGCTQDTNPDSYVPYKRRDAEVVLRQTLRQGHRALPALKIDEQIALSAP
jgi:hypothetical protein